MRNALFNMGRRLGYASMVLMLCISGGAWIADAASGQDSARTAPAPDAPSQPQRVILQTGRTTFVMGTLALEDSDVIAVRNLKGEVESFPKSRIIQVVRLTEPKPGQTGMVVMRDGQIREGVIIEDGFEHVLMEIPAGSGVRAKLKREIVSHVVLQPTVDERYAEYKTALKPGMYDAHFNLCQWLYDQGRFELAQAELQDLLDQVAMPEATKLLTLVNAQIELRRPSNGAGEGNGFRASDDAPSRPTREVSAPQLTAGDVNLIRVYEIDFDKPPRITITQDLVRAIIERYGTNRLVPASQNARNAMFRAASDQPLDIVRLMFELRARDLYSQIQVNSEPYSLNQFRLRVHDTWLINNCATTACHGGPPGSAGAFYLHRRNYKDEQVRYTNFLILERLKLDPEWPLINYERPEDSLIIQYGLSREDSTIRKPHPRVPGWKPAFNPVNHRMKQDAIDWIKTMMQPRPEYPIDFDPAITGPNSDSSQPEPDRSGQPPR